MITYTRDIDLETFYNGDFKTDKEIIVLTFPLELITSYRDICLQACILNPHNASVIANSKEFADIIVEKWMPDRSDKYPFTINCKVDKWLIEKDQNEEYFSFVTDVQITSIDIYKHLCGETPVVDGYYIFTLDGGKFDDRSTNSGYIPKITNDDKIDMVKDFLEYDLKRVEIPNTVNKE